MDKEFKAKADLFFSVLSQGKFGSIKVYYEGKKIFSHCGDLLGPIANISLLHKKCLDDFFLKGDLGWAESYIEGNWESSNLSDFLEWGLRIFMNFQNILEVNGLLFST